MSCKNQLYVTQHAHRVVVKKNTTTDINTEEKDREYRKLD